MLPYLFLINGGSTNMEIWKPIKGWEDVYEISNQGRVKSIRNNLIRKNTTANTGYKQVCLSENGIPITKTIHRLVAEHFLNKSSGRNYVNHVDGNKDNNSIENLEWCTQQENIQHSHKLGLSKNERNNPSTSKVVFQMKDGVVINTFLSTMEASRITGVNRSSIGFVCRGINKTAGGFVWKYKEATK